MPFFTFGFAYFFFISWRHAESITFPLGILAPLVYLNLNLTFPRSTDILGATFQLACCLSSYSLTGSITGAAFAGCFNFIAKRLDGISARFVSVEESHPIPRIRFRGWLSRQKCPDRMRRVVLRTADGERLEFLTNHLTLGASTIAAIYQQRWQIELFFKVLKQHLRIKTFVGTSANALHTQIWTALIAVLLLKYLQLRARFGWSLSNLVALLRMNLFVYRDLWAWLDQPFTPPPLPLELVQQQLPLG